MIIYTVVGDGSHVSVVETDIEKRASRAIAYAPVMADAEMIVFALTLMHASTTASEG